MVQTKKRVPNEIPAFLGVLVFELLYLAFFGNWLNQWFVFRAHLPAIFVSGAIFMSAAISYYEYHGIGPQEGVVRRGDMGPRVALTFDDGPNPEYTNQILDILKEKQVKASFFMVGKHIEKYPETARRVRDEGHDIGNHTYSHRDLVPATRKTVIKEIERTDKVISRVLGVKTRLFRPPRGIFSNAVRRLIVSMGFTIALWTVSAMDWRGGTPKAMVRRIKHRIRGGGVILFHDSGALVRSEGADRGNTVEALPLVIDELRRRGYVFTPLSEMLAEDSSIEAEKLTDALKTPTPAAGQEI